MPHTLSRPTGPSLLEVLPWGDPTAERRRLVHAAGAALLVHAALFAVVWPGDPMAVPPEILEAPRYVVHTLRLRPPEPAPAEPVAATPPAERPTVLVPAPAQDPPEPVAPAIEITVPVATPPEALDPGFALPAGPPPPASAPERFDPGTMAPPDRLHAPPPAYTEAARRARKQGDVIVEAVIGTDGRVHEARILKSLGFGLDESTLRALSGWRFAPARKGGREITVAYTLVVRFRLER